MMLTLSIYGCGSSGDSALSPSVREKWVTAENGNQIYVRSTCPSEGKQYPAVIVIVGGLAGGTPFIDSQTAGLLVQSGYAVIAFNPQGRGSGEPGGWTSEGTEDYNGYIHQDDLKCVIESLQEEPFVDPGRIGIVSYSFGVSIAAGCLARHPDLKVKFLIDMEGPSDNYVIMCDPWLLDGRSENDRKQAAYAVFGHYGTAEDPSTAEWWRQREALRFIKDITVPYMRIQSFWDHAQPPNERYPYGFDFPPLWFQNKHAIDMVHAATNGLSPWVRMNVSAYGNTPNLLYDHENRPLYVDGSMGDDATAAAKMMVDAVTEMFALIY